MTKQKYFDFAESFFRECLEISKRKNADYTGGSDDPFSNFTSVEALGIKTEHGFLTRMMDKMKRISAFVHNGELQVKDEAVTDTLRDLANYAALLAGFIESGKVGAAGAGVANPFDSKPFFPDGPALVVEEPGWNQPVPMTSESPENAEATGNGNSFWVEIIKACNSCWYKDLVGARCKVVENPCFPDRGVWYRAIDYRPGCHIEARHCKIVDGPHPENFRK